PRPYRRAGGGEVAVEGKPEDSAPAAHDGCLAKHIVIDSPRSPGRGHGGRARPRAAHRLTAAWRGATGKDEQAGGGLSGQPAGERGACRDTVDISRNSAPSESAHIILPRLLALMDDIFQALAYLDVETIIHRCSSRQLNKYGKIMQVLSSSL